MGVVEGEWPRLSGIPSRHVPEPEVLPWRWRQQLRAWGRRLPAAGPAACGFASGLAVGAEGEALSGRRSWASLGAATCCWPLEKVGRWVGE